MHLAEFQVNLDQIFSLNHMALIILNFKYHKMKTWNLEKALRITVSDLIQSWEVQLIERQIQLA